MKNTSGLSKIQKQKAGERFAISVVCGIAAFFISEMFDLDLISRLMSGWIIFCIIQIATSWWIFNHTTPKQTKLHANIEDGGRAAIFMVVLLATFAGLLAVFILIAKAKVNESHAWLYLVLGMLGMFLSWFLVHTIYTVRYAHLYYEMHGNKIHGGLKFPHDDEPDFIDFAYHSLVIGMTFQVSDIDVTTRKMRRLTLWHSVISFVFNTCIIALTINAAAGIAG